MILYYMGRMIILDVPLVPKHQDSLDENGNQIPLGKSDDTILCIWLYVNFGYLYCKCNNW
jgi:hypothetical protein